MAYFTKQQEQYLESIGAERLRDGAYMLSFREIYSSILVEACGDEFCCTVENVRGLCARVFGEDLKRTIRSALRRYKHFAKTVNKMVEHIDELYPKTEGIPRE